MKIYVDKIPKDCSECGLCMEGQLKLQKKGRYVNAKGCVLGDFYKYRTMDDEIDTCPLEVYKVNQTAIDCLKEMKEYAEKKLQKFEDVKIKMTMMLFLYNIEYFIDNKIKELEGNK